jgi:muramidase (phage lysozyme)
LACIRQRESGGNYSAVSANGLYHGAYQFLQSTWNGAAQLAGRPDLVGVPPEKAAPADQDAVALALYRASGLGPWGGHCP